MKETLKKIGLVFNRDTALVQWGSVLATMAATTTYLVFAWWVLESTGSVAQFGTIVTVGTALQTLAQFFVGALGDRLGSMRVMRAAAAVQALLVLALTIGVWTGEYNFYAALAINALLAVASGCVGAMNNPVLAEVAPEGRLAEVLAQRGALVSAAKLAAPAIAASMLAAGGGSGAMAVALLMCSLGAAALCRVKVDGDKSKADGDGSKSAIAFVRNWAKDAVRGVVAFSKVRVDFLLCLMTCSVNMALPAYFTVLLPYYVVTVYDLPASYLGIFDAAFCAGMMVGGMKTVGWLNVRVGKVNAIFVSVLALAVMVVSITLSKSPWLLGAAQFLGGCFMLSIYANVGSLRALATPKAYRARVMSSASFLTSISMVPGIALCTWIVHNFGANAGAFVMTGIIVVSVLSIKLIPDATRLLGLSEGEAQGAYERLYPKAFAERGWA